MGKYKRFYIPGHPIADRNGCVQEHQMIWNQHHPEDPIKPGDGYVIHHINEIETDNRIENLQKMTMIEHSYLHNKNNKISSETKIKMSIAHMGKKNSIEHNKNIGLAKKGQIPWNKGTKGIVKPNKGSFKKGHS